jgi:hypothetical protein
VPVNTALKRASALGEDLLPQVFPSELDTVSERTAALGLYAFADAPSDVSAKNNRAGALNACSPMEPLYFATGGLNTASTRAQVLGLYGANMETEVGGVVANGSIVLRRRRRAAIRWMMDSGYLPAKVI